MQLIQSNTISFQAAFRGPRVTISGDKEDPALDFGFIHFRPGCSVQRQFEIVNHDGVHAKWSLAEVEHCVDKEYVRHKYFGFLCGSNR